MRIAHFDEVAVGVNKVNRTIYKNAIYPHRYYVAVCEKKSYVGFRFKCCSGQCQGLT